MTEIDNLKDIRVEALRGIREADSSIIKEDGSVLGVFCKMVDLITHAIKQRLVFRNYFLQWRRANEHGHDILNENEHECTC